MPDLIACPNCGTRFEAGAVMREQVGRELRQEFQAEAQRQVALAVEVARAEANDELGQKNEELRGARRKLEEAAREQAEALRRQRELEERQRLAEVEVEKRIAAEGARIREQADREARERAAAALAAQTAAMDKELAESRVKLADAARKEADLLRKERELADREIQSGLEMEKRITAEAAKIRERAEQDAAARAKVEADNQRLREQEHLLRIQGLNRTVADLQQKLQQGSMQTQGEAQEVTLRNILVDAFPRDTIEDVPKGMEGADLVQRVADAAGTPVGVILWESKRTKHWSDEWLAKLSQDRTEARAGVAVLVTQALPEGIPQFGERNGIWICSWPHARALAAVLRSGMAELARTRLAAEGRGDKIDKLYAYLTGPDFKNRMQGALEAIVTLRSDLEDEKRAMSRLWAKREKQIERAETGISRFVGDVQGIGALPADAMPTLGLELAPPALGAGDAEDDADAAEEPAREPAPPADRTLVEILFALLPEDGTAIGNATCQHQFLHAARDQLGRDLIEADYLQCRDALLAQKRARKGKGRGGSVARV